MTKIKIYTVVLIFFFLTSCANYVAEIGDVKITYSDINYKRKVEKAYMDGDLENKYTAVVAAISLINDALEKIVAQKYNVSATKKDFQWIDDYASKNSKNPELLGKVRDIFKFNKIAYYKIYLEPKVNNVKLRTFFVNHPEIHKKSRELIWKAYKFAHETENLKEVANKLNLKYVEQKINKNNESSIGTVVNILKIMQVGELYKDLLEDEYSCYILRLKSKSEAEYVVERVYVEKKRFDDWFAEEIKNVPIVFNDKKLEVSITDEYPEWYKQKVNKEETK